MENNKIDKLLDAINDIKDDDQLKNIKAEISQIEKKLKSEPESSLKNTKISETWQKVLLSRDAERLKPQDYIKKLIPDFIEFMGDKKSGDDKSIIGGIGFFHDIPVTVIGTRKGKNIKENILYNFGMPSPNGYRKALRLAKQAEKFKRPVIFFVDTPGAYCGIEAEENGISEAIATNLAELSNLKVPTITIITGEGGSGGALALSVSDKIFMMENAIFSVISPEGCASILFKDSSKADLAAESLKITADKLLSMGIIDHAINESEKNSKEIIKSIDKLILNTLEELRRISPESLIENRYLKYRKIGYFLETEEPLPDHKATKNKFLDFLKFN